MNRLKIRTGWFGIALTALLLPGLVAAQENGNVPETKAPGSFPGGPGACRSGARSRGDERARSDWPALGRFEEENLKLGPPAPGEDRVVFMGDSITEGWHLDGSFPGKPYLNRGISGQTTPQMVLRFHQDVVDLKPKVVIILAGINDIAGNTGPMTPEQTEDNLAAMAEIATANHIKVVLCSVLPAYDFPWSPGKCPRPKWWP